jgi:hypothetical protein
VGIPLDGRPRDLETLVNGKVDALISDDDIASLGEGGDGRGDGSVGLRVDDC